VAPRIDKLTPKQQRAIIALLAGGSVKAAARRAGVGYTTLRRWLKEGGFREALRRAGREAMQLALAGVQGAAPDAVRALRRALGDADVDVRLRAADKLLGHLPRLAGFVDLEERVTALEARAAAREREQPS
jgi:transposase-like protein